jgi:hypothetical protein
MVVIGQKVGSFGAFRDGMEIHGRATASADRQLVSLENASHYDLYDRPEATGPALEKAIPFLKKHLGLARALSAQSSASPPRPCPEYSNHVIEDEYDERSRDLEKQ